MAENKNSYRVQLKRPAVDVKRLADGSLILRSPYDREPAAANVGEWLRHWAGMAPTRPFLIQQTPEEGRRELTYGDALKLVLAVSQALVKKGLSVSSPLMILSKNGIENAILQLAAMDVGIPAVHINPAYSLSPKRIDVFEQIFNQVKPGLIFAADGAPFENALRYGVENGAEAVICGDPAPNLAQSEFARLTTSWRKGAAKKARAQVTPQSVAKIHFTGSMIEEILGIVSTQATMCANQESLAAIFPISNDKPPLIVDDAPWHRASGGNLVFNAVLRNGGTLYIDRFSKDSFLSPDGDIALPSPTVHITELLALYSLLPSLEVNNDMQKIFFQDLELIWVVGGAITDEANDRLQTIAQKQTGYSLPVLSSFSALGTASVNTGLYFASDQTGNIGLPVPGTLLKLSAGDDSEDEIYEMGVRMDGKDDSGPLNWRDGAPVPALTDEDGYFQTGDAVKMIDPMRPYLGIERIGRISET